MKKIKLTKELLKEMNACSDGYKWFLKSGSEDLLTTLLAVNSYKSDWARWLFTNLMSVQQRRQVAIFAAEQVLHFFEAKYPTDKRPRLAIETAKAVLKLDTVENRELARIARNDAADAAAAAAAADAAAADAAAYAAYAAADADAADAAAYAYAYAAYAAYAYAYADADRKKMQELIIKEAVRILEGSDNGGR